MGFVMAFAGNYRHRHWWKNEIGRKKTIKNPFSTKSGSPSPQLSALPSFIVIDWTRREIQFVVAGARHYNRLFRGIRTFPVIL